MRKNYVNMQKWEGIATPAANTKKGNHLEKEGELWNHICIKYSITKQTKWALPIIPHFFNIYRVKISVSSNKGGAADAG